MSIPKIIHYVWVGGQEKNAAIRRCMKSWKKILKDYQIIEWNENNFDLHSNKFVEEAYKQKKWAFVSDYIRAYVIYHYGGIYLDTDIIVMKNFDTLLNNEAFVGFENPQYPFTAVFGAIKGHPLTKDILDYYKNLSFEFDPQDEMAKVNTKIVSDILIKKYGCQINNHEQTLRTNIHVYPDNVLCNPSLNSIAIHVFTGTWMESKSSWKKNCVMFFKTRIHNRLTLKAYLIIRNLF